MSSIKKDTRQADKREPAKAPDTAQKPTPPTSAPQLKERGKPAQRSAEKPKAGASDAKAKRVTTEPAENKGKTAASKTEPVGATTMTSEEAIFSPKPPANTRDRKPVELPKTPGSDKSKQLPAKAAHDAPVLVETGDGNSAPPGREVMEPEHFEDTLAEAVEQAKALSPDDIERVLQEAVEHADELVPEEDDNRWHPRRVREISVATVLRWWNSKKLRLPLCQRMYLYTKALRDDMLYSMKRNWSLGSIEIAQLKDEPDPDMEGYLTDGHQRVMSWAIMATDPSYTEKERKMILVHQAIVVTMQEMTAQDIKKNFLLKNRALKVAGPVKERSELSDDLNYEIVAISKDTIFEDLASILPQNFKTGAHDEAFAENILLAAAGQKPGDDRAKYLCKRLAEFEQDVLESKKIAHELAQRMYGILRNEELDKDALGKALNKNFLDAMAYVLADDREKALEAAEAAKKGKHVYYSPLTNQMGIWLIHKIWDDPKSPLTAYSETVGSGSSDKTKLEKRIDVLNALLGDYRANPNQAEAFSKRKREELTQKRVATVAKLEAKQAREAARLAREEKKQRAVAKKAVAASGKAF